MSTATRLQHLQSRSQSKKQKKTPPKLKHHHKIFVIDHLTPGCLLSSPDQSSIQPLCWQLGHGSVPGLARLLHSQLKMIHCEVAASSSTPGDPAASAWLPWPRCSTKHKLARHMAGSVQHAYKDSNTESTYVIVRGPGEFKAQTPACKNVSLANVFSSSPISKHSQFQFKLMALKKRWKAIFT